MGHLRFFPIPFLAFLFSITVLAQVTDVQPLPKRNKHPSPIALLEELRRPDVTDEEISKITESCPLLDRQELDDAYAEWRKAITGCPEAHSLIRQIDDLSDDYEALLGFEFRKKNPTTIQHPNFFDTSIQPLYLLHWKADELLLKISGAEEKCAPRWSDFSLSALPFLALISPTSAVVTGETASFTSHLLRFFKRHKSGIAQKLALCSAGRLMNHARSGACQVAAYDSPYLNGNGTSTLQEEMQKVNERREAILAGARKTKTFKALSAYHDLQSQIGSLDPAKPTFLQAASALEKIRAIEESFSCDHESSSEISQMCDVLGSMKSKLKPLASRSIPVESVPRRGDAIEGLKIEVQSLTVLDDPEKYLVMGPQERNPPGSPMPDGSFEEINQGLEGWGIFRNKKESGSPTDGHDPHNPIRTVRFLREAIDALPERIHIDPTTCKVVRCFWAAGHPDVIFKENASNLALNTGWKFVKSQTYRDLVNAAGSGPSIEMSLVKSKRSTIEKIIKKCSSYSGQMQCELSCDPYKSATAADNAGATAPAGIKAGSTRQN